MEELFKKQELLYEITDQIENDLFKLTGYNFPSPRMLYFKATDDEITPDDFEKAFYLMFEYKTVFKELYGINAELEKIKKELKQ